MHRLGRLRLRACTDRARAFCVNFQSKAAAFSRSRAAKPSCQRHIAQAPPRPFRVFPLQAMEAQRAVYDLLVRLGSSRISSHVRRI